MPNIALEPSRPLLVITYRAGARLSAGRWAHTNRPATPGRGVSTQTAWIPRGEIDGRPVTW